MLALIKELMEHDWEFSYKEGALYLILGNTEREIHTDEEAEQLRLELYQHWWATGNWVDNTVRALQAKPRALNGHKMIMRLGITVNK